MKVLELVDYNIYVGEVWDAFGEFMAKMTFSKVCVIVDENTARDCLPILRKKYQQRKFQVITIPAGEIHKTLATCEYIWQQMMTMGLDRHSLVINLGGGVIGDMGGFCAATFKRGMSFIQMPTTLLAQVDASIGGKLGIDFNQVKNAIGLFNNPAAVFIDSIFLKTLPFNELRSGFAEIIKHGLIADIDLWNDLSIANDLTQLDIEDLIYRSLQVKQKIVLQDPLEKGIRKVLNFGHTIGHAIESHALRSIKPLLHGEAVAIGMICESWLSKEEWGLSPNKLDKISQFILRHYDKRIIKEKDFPILLETMKQDKKNQGKTINFTYLSQPGKAIFDCTSTSESIIQSLRYYNTLSAQ